MAASSDSLTLWDMLLWSAKGCNHPCGDYTQGVSHCLPLLFFCCVCCPMQPLGNFKEVLIPVAIEHDGNDTEITHSRSSTLWNSSLSLLHNCVSWSRESDLLSLLSNILSSWCRKTIWTSQYIFKKTWILITKLVAAILVTLILFHSILLMSISYDCSSFIP